MWINSCIFVMVLCNICSQVWNQVTSEKKGEIVEEIFSIERQFEKTKRDKIVSHWTFWNNGFESHPTDNQVMSWGDNATFSENRPLTKPTINTVKNITNDLFGSNIGFLTKIFTPKIQHVINKTQEQVETSKQSISNISHRVFRNKKEPPQTLQPPRHRYEATWKSLDTRPTPKWFDEAKVGLFIHWGVYSVPSFGTSNQWSGYAEWFLYEWKGSPYLMKGSGYRFDPTWASLDKRVAPSWYDNAKIGIFIHWGVYSVPSFGVDGELGEWFWYVWKSKENEDFVNFMDKNYPPGFQYSDFVSEWKAEFFNATEWADLVEESGAKYFVATTKHHDGYTLWRSNVSWNWNSVDTGPHRDILAELSNAIRKKDNLHFGLYYSLFEWYHPLYLYDKSNNFTTKEYVTKVMFPQMYDYVTQYKPEYIWSDGDWEADDNYFGSTEFLAWLYNDSPVRDKVLVNDRWGIGTNCKHGDVKTCGIDRFNPHSLQRFKWENAMTIDHHSWGFRRNAKLDDYLTMYNLTAILAETVSCGGNLVMNVGPTADGRIAPIFQERLRQMGSWLKINGEGIYSTHPWRVQNDTSAMKTWYTRKDTVVYAILLEWPSDGMVILHHPLATAETRVYLLGYPSELSWKILPGTSGLVINVLSIGVTQLPCHWAWTFKLVHVQ